MIRFGLCCMFVGQEIRFRRTTASHLLGMDRKDALKKLSALCLENAGALHKALVFCVENGIGGFRINSEILPVKTHPEAGYEIGELPDAAEIVRAFTGCGDYAAANDIRTSFHPDQFVLLNSPRESVVENSVAELTYQAEVAEWVNADVINIHGGGIYGEKTLALQRLRTVIAGLSPTIRQRLTLENDDRIYTPEDLLPVCTQLQIPLVYDVHHHRCNPDRLSVPTATELAAATWNRQPLFHLSSPRDGWGAKNPRPHHDYIDPADFPVCWQAMDLTVEVEAKAKELALARLRIAGD